MRFDADTALPLPTTVDFAPGAATFPVERTGNDTLLIGPVRDIALPRGVAAFGFHGAPGTPPSLLQGQLDDPDALEAIFQFQDGAWLTFRPGGLAILNSLTRIDPPAPQFLSLSRSTRWAGPLLYSPDRDVAIASGFTSVAYTGLIAAMPEALLAQFANAVTAIFAFDNELGGYRTFRTTGPSFLNDLETIHPFDVFFVLTERSTSLAIPEFLLPAG